jgi:hypothetical protein
MHKRKYSFIQTLTFTTFDIRAIIIVTVNRLAVTVTPEIVSIQIRMSTLPIYCRVFQPAVFDLLPQTLFLISL